MPRTRGLFGAPAVPKCDAGHMFAGHTIGSGDRSAEWAECDPSLDGRQATDPGPNPFVQVGPLCGVEVGMLKNVAFACLATVVLTAPVLAAEDSVGIGGEWKGTGFVQKDEKSKPMQVNCTIEGTESADRIGFDGECRAMLIMKRAIGADLTRNGDQYSGTYVGSNVGVAELQGGPEGPDSFVLTMTFPKEVNGDDKATMTIERPRDGKFTITTVDRMTSGDDVTTSQITFERSGRAVASE
ncbi:hypothetical protein L1787_21375 [Acuticoccus sp. M5D2P5]|uniref:hypothetical protein n=1 Tax=Acuticoccus kalidii TaxID=2910977 RepID=UPI001F3624BB|nr:hypothetical protein [Acuticoccus kalidii]MCF3935944.1 hypothetical protein [Acuticoccus kalidii]